jgi:hypothetical protein
MPSGSFHDGLPGSPPPDPSSEFTPFKLYHQIDQCSDLTPLDMINPDWLRDHEFPPILAATQAPDAAMTMDGQTDHDRGTQLDSFATTTFQWDALPEPRIDNITQVQMYPSLLLNHGHGDVNKSGYILDSKAHVRPLLVCPSREVFHFLQVEQLYICHGSHGTLR